MKVRLCVEAVVDKPWSEHTEGERWVLYRELDAVQGIKDFMADYGDPTFWARVTNTTAEAPERRRLIWILREQ